MCLYVQFGHDEKKQIMTTPEDSSLLPLEDGETWAELLARCEAFVGQFFRLRSEYEYFMLLPINNETRLALLILVGWQPRPDSFVHSNH